MPNTPLIHMTGLSKTYRSGELQSLALQDINLTIHHGEFVSLAGPSGCGKSTLLSLMGLLDVPSGGHYSFCGSNTTNLSRDERAHFRNGHIGFVFQSFNLVSDLTVAENVALPLSYRSGLDGATIRTMVDRVLEKVSMGQRRHHFPAQLSGGQQQRVAVARAVVTQPAVLLADEPTGNLDSKNAEAVLELFGQLHGEGTAIVMVSHDPRWQKRAHRVIELFDGWLVSDQQCGHREPAAATAKMP